MPRVTFQTSSTAWASEAPFKLLEKYPPIDMLAIEQADAYIIVLSPENAFDLAEIDPERRAALVRSRQPVMEKFLVGDIVYVTCAWPTPSLAQEAGMSVRAFEDFVFDACLLDWEKESSEIRRIAERLDRANEMRIVGEETDLTVNLKDRVAAIDDGRSNMPGGELYFGPHEAGTNGVITFSEFPATLLGNEVKSARLEFKEGRVVDVSASQGEDFLIQMLDADEGARVLGELGIGTNHRITRHMKSTLFDEKIGGTIHLALGASLPETGGSNESAIHWDIVKDLRSGGKILCDGEMVQENGRWLF